MPEIAKVRYTHDAMIDEILLNPAISQNELGRIFGFSAAWVSICVNSDAFQERLQERKAEIVDPVMRATIQEKVDGAASRAMDRIIERLDSPTSGAIKTADLVSIAKLAVAPKASQTPAPQTNLYVMQIPAPAQNAQQWLANRSDPRGAVPLVEEVPRG